MKAIYYTLGCKVNQYETEILKQAFAKEDLREDDAGNAQLCIVNSCTVTETGDKKTRQMLRKLKRENPEAVIVLTGCYPQAFPERAAELLDADIITGTTGRADLVEYVRDFLKNRTRIVAVTPHKKDMPFEKMSSENFAGHTRAFLKIEDGCDRFCSYCIIPFARGPVRSKHPDDIKTELLSLAQKGYREVVFVGINLPCYGKDLEKKLFDAVRLVPEVPGIERIRLGSLEPELLGEEDLRALADIPQFCPQFHLSLQSGTEKILKKMNRQYDTAEYETIVENIRKVFPNPSITTDIMVGFPGESEQDFLQTAEFVQKIQFAKMHVFPFSARAGTAAAKMDGQIAKDEKMRRAKHLGEIEKEMRHRFLQSQVGKTAKILVETKKSGGYFQGYSENYTPVFIQDSSVLPGEIYPVQITDVQKDFCVAKIK